MLKLSRLETLEQMCADNTGRLTLESEYKFCIHILLKALRKALNTTDGVEEIMNKYIEDAILEEEER